MGNLPDTVASSWLPARLLIESNVTLNYDCVCALAAVAKENTIRLSAECWKEERLAQVHYWPPGAVRKIVQSGERCLSFPAAATLEPRESPVVTELSKYCNFFKGGVDAHVRR
jgi:hypothetical protein